MEQLTFDQRLILAIAPVVVTALLAGLVAPFILKIMEARKAEAMKRMEASLARQTKILDAQAKLLDDLTSALWAWRYKIMRVTYSAADRPNDQLEVAWNDYDSQMWDLLHEIRVQVTRSRRLVSQKAFEVLLKQYRSIVEVDRKLGTARQFAADERKRELGDLNQYIYDVVSSEIDDALQMIAEQVLLVSPEAHT